MLSEIQKIRDQYQEPFFRMAIYHLIEKGTSNFDDDTVTATKQAIRDGDAALSALGKTPIMRVSFQNNIIDCAAKLSKHSITDILRFVKHYVHFDGDEKLTIRCKNCDEVLTGDDQVPVNSGYEDEFYECYVCHEYSMEDGSVILCDSCGNYYTPNHATDNDDDSTCPYCSD